MALEVVVTYSRSVTLCDLQSILKGRNEENTYTPIQRQRQLPNGASKKKV